MQPSTTTPAPIGAALQVRIERCTTEAEGIAGFELVAIDGGLLPAFTAGAHLDVHLPGGIVRQYSLCNAPSERHRYCLGVLRDPASRGGSLAMHDVCRQGTTLWISTPRNHFPLHAEAERHLLFAGGIGVTPILAMAESLCSAGAAFDLHYCTRSPARTAYLPRLRASTYASRVHVHHDDGLPEQKLDLARCLDVPDPGTHLYVCGPKGFLDMVRATARDKGWRETQIHFEYFVGGDVHAADDASFELVLQRSGRSIRVEAAQTVTQALAAQGIEVPVSCQQGVCGTCLTRVIEGAVDHKDCYLSPKEQAANDQFLPCCSRAAGARLVIDL